MFDPRMMTPSNPPTPLEDPTYTPRYQPVNGRIPDVVHRWGSRSQLRWFQRFVRDLISGSPNDFSKVHCSSLDHKGSCCGSCQYEEFMGMDPMDGFTCCCYGLDSARARQRALRKAYGS